MRYIDSQPLGDRLPEGWEDRSRQALDRVRAAGGDKGPEIDRHATLWQELKGVLEQIGHGKCWYCETKEDRSDNAVDHFRPKKRVDEDPAHPGYWWLAFDWTNFRFACTYCNSRRTDRIDGSTGGKHDHFPLVDPARRASAETDDVSQEEPMLLDPTLAHDPQLLWFSDDGRAEPRYRMAPPSKRQLRADASIRLYHLNDPRIVDARTILRRSIRRLVKDGKRFFSLYEHDDWTGEQAFETTTRELFHLLSAASEHSSAARAFLSGLRQREHPWIDDIVRDAS